MAFLSVGLIAMRLRLPPTWSEIRLGMSENQVAQIVPTFDVPWDSTRTAYKSEKLFGFGWQLKLKMGTSEVIDISKEFQVPGSPPLTIYTFRQLGSEIKTLNFGTDQEVEQAASSNH